MRVSKLQIRCNTTKKNRLPNDTTRKEYVLWRYKLLVLRIHLWGKSSCPHDTSDHFTHHNRHDTGYILPSSCYIYTHFYAFCACVTCFIILALCALSVSNCKSSFLIRKAQSWVWTIHFECYAIKTGRIRWLRACTWVTLPQGDPILLGYGIGNNVAYCWASVHALRLEELSQHQSLKRDVGVPESTSMVVKPPSCPKRMSVSSLSPTMQICFLSSLNVSAMLASMNSSGLPTTIGSFLTAPVPVQKTCWWLYRWW